MATYNMVREVTVAQIINKPFTTVEDQIKILERRGVVCDHDTSRALMRQGYYAIINGYKAPFLDAEATRAAGEDRYLPGTRFDDIYVIDGSKHSTKANAYFTGFGKTKTIVLFDTLVQSMTTEEICAVFAHEMGHGLHKDTLKNQIFTFVQMLILGVLAWLTLRTPEIFTAFGFDQVNYGFALLLIMNVEFALVSPLFGLLTSHFSRRAEYRADAQAAREGYGDALIRALKKLSRENFADLSPSPILVALEYSHPTLSQRIDAIRAAQK